MEETKSIYPQVNTFFCFFIYDKTNKINERNKKVKHIDYLMELVSILGQPDRVKNFVSSNEVIYNWSVILKKSKRTGGRLRASLSYTVAYGQADDKFVEILEQGEAFEVYYIKINQLRQKLV